MERRIYLFRSYARQCESNALRAGDERSAQEWQLAASDWHRLAAQAERQIATREAEG